MSTDIKDIDEPDDAYILTNTTKYDYYGGVDDWTVTIDYPCAEFKHGLLRGDPVYTIDVTLTGITHTTVDIEAIDIRLPALCFQYGDYQYSISACEAHIKQPISPTDETMVYEMQTGPIIHTHPIIDTPLFGDATSTTNYDGEPLSHVNDDFPNIHMENCRSVETPSTPNPTTSGQWVTDDSTYDGNGDTNDTTVTDTDDGPRYEYMCNICDSTITYRKKYESLWEHCDECEKDTHHEYFATIH